MRTGVRALAGSAVLGLALALPDAAAAQEAIVACEVKGHDLILYNRGEADLAAGTVIRWDAWNGKRVGEHRLEEPLKPFIGLQLSEALGASYFWDRPCAATVTAAATPAASTAPEQNEDQRNGKIHLQGGEGNLPASTSP
jgi:hypothetical protein